MTRKENENDAKKTDGKAARETKEIPKDDDGGAAEDRFPEKDAIENSRDRHGDECCRYHL